MRLYGQPVDAAQLRGAMHARVDATIGTFIGLPTPSLSATIITPTGTSRWGAVIVAGYTPPRRDDLDRRRADVRDRISVPSPEPVAIQVQVEPMPMTPEEVADLVRRARAAERDPGEQRYEKIRKRTACTRCGLAGHIASNRKYHPRHL